MVYNRLKRAYQFPVKLFYAVSCHLDTTGVSRVGTGNKT